MTRFVLALFAAPLPLAAQTSSLQGLVTDGQAAAIPEAVVTATNTGTSAARKTVTTETGAFSFAQVPPGVYKLVVEKPGFRAYSPNCGCRSTRPRVSMSSSSWGK